MDCKKLISQLNMIESCSIKMKDMIGNGNTGDDFIMHLQYIERRICDIRNELTRLKA